MGHFHLTWDIFILHGHSQLAWTFSPCMGILTLHGHSHLMWGIFTLHGHSHLVWAFSPYMGHFHIAWAFSSHVHLMWKTYLICSLPQPPHESPCIHPTTTANISPCMHLGCSLPCKNNIFHLMWKMSQNSDDATPITSIRYLYEQPNNICMAIIPIFLLLTSSDFQ